MCAYAYTCVMHVSHRNGSKETKSRFPASKYVTNVMVIFINSVIRFQGNEEPLFARTCAVNVMVIVFHQQNRYECDYVFTPFLLAGL
jgi:hypothetical protein